MWHWQLPTNNMKATFLLIVDTDVECVLANLRCAVTVLAIVLSVQRKLCCTVAVGSNSDVSGLGLDSSSVDKSRNSFRFVCLYVYHQLMNYFCYVGPNLSYIFDWLIDWSDGGFRSCICRVTQVLCGASYGIKYLLHVCNSNAHSTDTSHL